MKSSNEHLPNELGSSLRRPSAALFVAAVPLSAHAASDGGVAKKHRADAG
jgi:hypothetical protein